MVGRSAIVLYLDPTELGKLDGKSRKRQYFQHQCLSGVNPKTTKVALNLLAQEGLLVDQGSGRRRKIEFIEGGTIGPVGGKRSDDF